MIVGFRLLGQKSPNIQWPLVRQNVSDGSTNKKKHDVFMQKENFYQKPLNQIRFTRCFMRHI
jgi:hypothetical protein